MFRGKRRCHVEHPHYHTIVIVVVIVIIINGSSLCIKIIHDVSYYICMHKRRGRDSVSSTCDVMNDVTSHGWARWPPVVRIVAWLSALKDDSQVDGAIGYCCLQRCDHMTNRFSSAFFQAASFSPPKIDINIRGSQKLPFVLPGN